MTTRSLREIVEDQKDWHLDDSLASGVEDIHSEDVDGQPTIVFTFMNKASRNQGAFPDNHTIEGYPVKYNYQVTDGPGSVIDVRFGH